MDLGLRGKVVLIAGSSGGIGKAAASLFLEEGAAVIITGRDGERLGATVSELRNKFGNEVVMSHQGDLTIQREIVSCLAHVKERFGKLDVLVANIGCGKPFNSVSIEQEWRDMFTINLFGSVQLASVTASMMIQEQNGGSIVFISSIAGIEASGAPESYCAAKCALLSASKNLAQKVAAHHIRVNSVAPGNIIFEGGRWEELRRDHPHTIDEHIKKNVALQRFGTPEEIANVIVFISSMRSSFVTGACFVVDGGQTRKII
jgi:3-oxoacyl-[acyl-carrier protein] reductase